MVITRCLLWIALLVQISSGQTTYHVRTIAGGDSTGDGGQAVSALLSTVQGLALDAAGNLYLAETDSHRIRRITPAGTIQTIAGTGIAGFSGDGSLANAAQFASPYGISVDATGNLYVADFGNRRVRRISADGRIRTVAGGGSGAYREGMVATDIQFAGPRNVAVDAGGNLYISDFEGHRVYRIDPNGLLFLVAGTGVGGYGADGAGPTVALMNPAGLAVDRAGVLYIADSGNQRVCRVDRGALTTVSVPASLATPVGLALDLGGNLYIADARGWRLSTAGTLMPLPGGRDVAVDASGNVYVAAGPFIRRITPVGAISTYAGAAGVSGFGDGGDASLARLQKPVAVAVNTKGDIFVSEEGAHCIRAISSSGVITTIAGNGEASFTGDDGPASKATLSSPSGLAADSAGNLYISDTGNHRIRRISPDGLITTIAGGASRGSSGDGGKATAAALDTPTGIVIEPDGSLVFAETGNNCLRRISATGVITAVSTEVPLTAPRALALDRAGNIYVTEAQRILRIDRNGRVRTWGEGSGWNAPAGIVILDNGDALVADSGAHRIRRIAADGVTTTVWAGSGTAGYGGDGGTAGGASFNSPAGLALASGGRIYVADYGNQRVRLFEPQSESQPLTPAPSTELRIVNAATLLPGAIAPGELLLVSGLNVDANTEATLDIRFDGLGGAWRTVSNGRLLIQAPYRLAGRFAVDVEILSQNTTLLRSTLRMTDAAPGIFTQKGGEGPANAINEDLSINSPSKPAPRGSIITIFATGEGQTAPTAIDGRVSSGPTFPRALLPVSVEIGGYATEVVFVGSSINVPGLMQINARVPQYIRGGEQSLTLRVGNSTSQSGVTISLR